MKQKVIKLLEPYRDKTLSFGCEVTYEGMVGVPHINMAATVLQTCASGAIEIYTSYTRYMEKEDLKIIGHPLTLCELLRALNEVSDGHISISFFYKNIRVRNHCNGEGEPFEIPLNHRHIEDIPDTDPMWKQLLTILTA